MTNYIELVIPLDRDWLVMLDTIALPVIQSLPAGTPYFFTNDSNQVLRLRLEEGAFDKQKDEIYALLLAQLQSETKVKVYKQIYLLEEARFGKVANQDLHTAMFYQCSAIMIALLENAEQIDQYEIRMPYAVIAIQYLLQSLSEKERTELVTLYIKHWMYFNEQKNYRDLLKTFDGLYQEEVVSLRELLRSLDTQPQLQDIYANWTQYCSKFIAAMNSLEHIAEGSHRQKAYYYTDNDLEHPRKWEILADHIHLLMNRFGIQNEDETLLVYLTYCAMKRD
jgi:thiopeptide-type bacteriocin biosynthesis protein